MTQEEENKSNPGFQHKIALALVIAAAAGIAVYRFPVRQTLQDFLQWSSQQGTAGIFALVVFYIVASVFFLPASILTLGAGAIYGVARGTAIVSVGSTLGAAAAFLASRYFMRGWVAGKIESHSKFKAIDDAVAQEGWKIVVLTRLSPLFPFNFLNYAYGVTKVSLKHYFFASWIGMLPGTLLFVYFGALVGDVARVGGGLSSAPTAMQWALRGFGLAATIAVTVYITRIAKKALSARVS